MQPNRSAAYVLVPLYNRRRHIVAWAKVDAADAETVCARRWRRTHYGYAQSGTASKGTVIWMHRLILGLASGDKRQADHRNGDRIDCRRGNMRVVTNAQNCQNRIVNVGTSRYRGVSLRRDTGRWAAHVMVDGKRHCLGCYVDEDEAGRVAREGRRRLMPFYEPQRDGVSC